jgi:hypothetical protein
LRKLCFFIVVSVTAAFAVLPGAVLGAKGGGVTVYPNALTGVATRVTSQSTSVGSGTVAHDHGVRRRPREASALVPATAVPGTTSSGLSGILTGLQASFNGTSSHDSAVSNFNMEFEPPDQGLCVGNGFVADMVNSAYTVYHTNGDVVTGPFNINGPFDEGLTQFTSDPRCYYDASTNTWFAVILFVSGGDFGAFGDTSHLDIAVNSPNGPVVNGHPGDPTNPWIVYQIDTSTPSESGCPCLGDQPRLGIDSQNLYVGSDEFSIHEPQFDGGEIYAISKSDLVALKPTVHFARFPHLSIGGARSLAPQPALTTGASSTEYFLSSLDPNETFDQRIGVWAMTNTSAVTAGGSPTLSSLVLKSEAYGVPPNARQKGATSQLTTGDDRMQQTQFINGSIWGELDTALTIQGDAAERAGAAWFRVQPHLTAGKLDATTKILKQGYVAVKGEYFFFPALQAAPDGGAVMVGTLSGKDMFPSAAFATLTPGGGVFGPVQVAAAGSGSYSPDASRWGDYSWAVLDPSGTSVWLATEYVPPLSSQTPDGFANWGTEVMNVTAP